MIIRSLILLVLFFGRQGKEIILFWMLSQFLKKIIIFSGRCQEFYTNPVVEDNRPDPGVLKLQDGSGFVAISTSKFANVNDGPAFPIMFSKDLVNWHEVGLDLIQIQRFQLSIKIHQVGNVFPNGGWPQWAIKDMWAPEMQFVNGNFLIYFSGRDGASNQLSIGVARSLNPTDFLGPYEDLGQPLVQKDPGVIDVHWFRDPV